MDSRLLQKPVINLALSCREEPALQIRKVLKEGSVFISEIGIQMIECTRRTKRYLRKRVILACKLRMAVVVRAS